MRPSPRPTLRIAELALACSLAFSGACFQEIRELQPPDAAVLEDAGPVDSGAADAQVEPGDAALPADAGGGADAGRLEDAGETEDAGQADSGLVDAGVDGGVDGGLEPDAGSRCPEVACEGFTWCEYASGRCLPGCSNSAACGAGSCEPDHTCSCPANFHLCDGRCADDSSPLSCGERCSPCVPSAGMAAACVAGRCASTCTFPSYATPSGCASGAWVAAGVVSTCAAVGDAGVRCWGENPVGNLGDGTHGADAGRAEPTAALGLSGPFARVETSQSGHTCAVSAEGETFCWGGNLFGQTGNGDHLDIDVPFSVTLPAAVSLAVGVNHTCAASVSGSLYCWGKNAEGQLGDNRQPTPAYTPSRVMEPGSGAVAVAAGERNGCALLASGGLECWGTNSGGQLGNGGWDQSPVPIGVPSLTSGVAGVALGALHVCAVTEAGGVKCWGFDNACGRLGNGGLAVSRLPVDVQGLPGPAFAVSAGNEFSCALLRSGAVWCWGCNGYGQLGNDSTATSTVPVQVSGMGSGAIRISAGHSHACAVMEDRRILCWGANDNGQMGGGPGPNALTPVEIQGL